MLTYGTHMMLNEPLYTLVVTMLYYATPNFDGSGIQLLYVYIYIYIDGEYGQPSFCVVIKEINAFCKLEDVVWHNNWLYLNCNAKFDISDSYIKSLLYMVWMIGIP